MRIWDIHPGYLNRQSLLGEHRELHGIFSILLNGKKGYSRHPETLRWVNRLPALYQRHRELVSEMTLRGYHHRSPLPQIAIQNIAWPEEYIDKPHQQWHILEKKYQGKQAGRISFPRNTQQLWAQHKYSVMARSPKFYGEIGKRLSDAADKTNIEDMIIELIQIMHIPPKPNHLLNAIQHMWGYVSQFVKEAETDYPNTEIPKEMFPLIKKYVIDRNVTYLLNSTALSDLALYI